MNSGICRENSAIFYTSVDIVGQEEVVLFSIKLKELYKAAV